ncbi:TMEM173 and/or Tantalus domain containing protein [Asbolus verrucosus]|uniref:TMEM173 and/or Tantalus domain containing protein n=1 Tax=Asbolus verrucosus TaxID=1661398 RepID=A0A482VIW9_ASBVE|nr:TMEM173 and/or Tantalus domain containing protein [Asbolus verrucosus]
MAASHHFVSELEKLKTEVIELLLRIQEAPQKPEVDQLNMKIESLLELLRELQSDLGVGLAYMYFCGYLKLIIPKTGTSEKHLKELMQDYEDQHKIKFEFYKMFVLIPKSLYCATSLEEVSSRIEKCVSLDEKRITRAGVQDRIYKNSVYKIVSDESVYKYAIVEYATPLNTFREIFNYYEQDSGKHEKKDRVLSRFYSTLQKVLQEDEGCRDYCELVLYEDKDENGDFSDVGDIILERMQNLQQTPPPAMELEDTMASLQINDLENAPSTNESGEASAPPEPPQRRRSARLMACPETPEKRRVLTKPTKIPKDSSLSSIENYYLDKRVKRLNLPLETIYEEVRHYRNDEVHMSSKKFLRAINFTTAAVKNKSKIRKRKAKVKHLMAHARVNNKKIAMKFLFEKLAEIKDE